MLGTVKHWSQSEDWEDEQGQLIGYMMEIFDGLNGVSVSIPGSFGSFYDRDPCPLTLLYRFLIGGTKQWTFKKLSRWRL